MGDMNGDATMPPSGRQGKDNLIHSPDRAYLMRSISDQRLSITHTHICGQYGKSQTKQHNSNKFIKYK